MIKRIAGESSVVHVCVSLTSHLVLDLPWRAAHGPLPTVTFGVSVLQLGKLGQG